MSRARRSEGPMQADPSTNGAFRGDRRAVDERERFERSFHAAPIGMALVAPDGKFLDVNAALCALLDRKPEALRATGFQPLTHPEDLDADLELVGRCLDGEIDGYEMDKRYLRPDGSVVWGELHVSLIRDDAGEPVHFVSQIADITDRKRAELALRRRNAELKRLAASEPPAAPAGPASLDPGIGALISALAARDHYTGQHSVRVVELASEVARRLGLADEAVVEVERVALLHDIGKVGVPDSVLNKEGPLDELEWELMRHHPVIGERIVASIPGIAPLAPAVRAEHEHYDGSGYPDGLRGDQIPIASRITLACDAYHAMVSDRPYRAAMSAAEAIAELEAGAGTQFDPEVVEVLLAALPRRGP